MKCSNCGGRGTVSVRRRGEEPFECYRCGGFGVLAMPCHDEPARCPFCLEPMHVATQTVLLGSGLGVDAAPCPALAGTAHPLVACDQAVLVRGSLDEAQAAMWKRRAPKDVERELRRGFEPAVSAAAPLAPRAPGMPRTSWTDLL